MIFSWPQPGTLAYLGLCTGVWLLLVSLVSFGLIALDRRRAMGGFSRLPELNLLCLAAMGGWPGMSMGLRLCRALRFSPGFKGWLRVIALAQILLAGMAALPPQSLLGAAELVAGAVLGQVRAEERRNRPGRIVLASKGSVSKIVTIASDR